MTLYVALIHQCTMSRATSVWKGDQRRGAQERKGVGGRERERERLERERDEEGSRKSNGGDIRLSSFLRGDFSTGLIQTVDL